MKTGNEAAFILKSISAFLNTYAPLNLTSSTNTLKSYRISLNKYLSFLDEQKGYTIKTLDKDCFDRPVIEEWMRYMRTKEGLSSDTCNIRLCALRVFLKYLRSTDVSYLYLYANAVDIPLMKVEKKKVNGLTRSAVKTLLSVPNQSTDTGKRNLLFMIIAYGTGARMSEILNIQIKDLHLDETKPYVNIVGKGNKSRSLYLLPKAVAHLKRYIKDSFDDTPAPEDYLFRSRNGNGKEKLSSKAIEKHLHEIAKKAHEKCEDVPLDLHAHQFRHARATHWLEDGINIVEISTLLGHEQLETTMKYLDISTEDQMKALATLEDENDKKVSRKWKSRNSNKLSDYLK